jgi:serine protease Do
MFSSRTKQWSAVGFIFLGVVLGIIFASNLRLTSDGFAFRSSGPVVLGAQDPVPQDLMDLQKTSQGFTMVSKEILPTVVSISTSRIVRRSSRNDLFDDPIFREFFGRRFNREEPEVQRQQGLGSGVIVSQDGYILTNHHVIVNADDIKVTLYDNRTFEAELVGSDPLTEIAVIKVDGLDLPVARLGDSDEVQIGEWVLAFGNPMYLSSTVTAGIISAKGRAIGIIEDENYEQAGGSYAIENFLQTDAAINPGNSGGALVNLRAEVIGINTAIASRTGGYQGYGFAVPINLCKKIMTDLIKQGYVTRAWMGISMRPVDEAMAERFNLDRPRGVLVQTVVDGSPADEAGLTSLDVILKIDGRDVNKSNEVQNYIALRNPGDVVTLVLLRDGREKTLKVTLGQRDTGRESAPDREEGEGLPVLGLNVQTLDDNLRNRLEAYENDEGVVVVKVERYSAAWDARIDRGDLIYQIENKRIRSISDYREALRSFPKGEVVIFHLKRGSTEYHAFVKLPE